MEIMALMKFNGQRKKMLVFVNTCRLYIRMKMEEETKASKIFWVLGYVRGYQSCE